MSDERRSADRTPLEGEVPGEVTVYIRMTVLDLSLHGVQIETPFPLQNNSLHDFRLNLDERSVVVKGRVVHCQVGNLREQEVCYRSGMEFIEVSAHALSAIRDFIAIRRAASARPADAPGT